MKKILSISLSVLLLISVAGIKVADHYCGGVFSAAKISFSGKHATCGMESGNACRNYTGNSYNNHCCDDRVISLSINDFYDISHFDLKFSDNKTFSHFNSLFSLPVFSALTDIKINPVTSQPGSNYHGSHLCPLLCVFRI